MMTMAIQQDWQRGNGWLQNEHRSMGQLANALGWFSIGLGLVQVAAPGSVARLIGVNDEGDNNLVLRAVGLRELASGVGILTQSRPTGWLWARVGGDLVDLGLLSAALNSDSTRRDRLGMAAAAVIGITFLDLLCSQQFSRHPEAVTASAPWSRAIHVHKAITINRSMTEVYEFWRDFQNLPRFMNHLESVQVMDGGRSHWRAKAPGGMTVEWDAEIIEDRPNELIQWRSLEGADVDNAGAVCFQAAPGGRGTEVHVELYYNPPGGVIGAAVAKLFGEAPDQQIAGDLRRFKQVMEIGEVMQSDASIHTHPYPAQPPEEPVEWTQKELSYAR